MSVAQWEIDAEHVEMIVRVVIVTTNGAKDTNGEKSVGCPDFSGFVVFPNSPRQPA